MTGILNESLYGMLLQLGATELLYISIGIMAFVFFMCIGFLRVGIGDSPAPSGAKRMESESPPTLTEEHVDFTEDITKDARMPEAELPSAGAPRAESGPSVELRHASEASPSSSGVTTVLERYASLIYWDRMAVNEEYDLIVSLHEKHVRVQAVDSSGVADFDTKYEIPDKGRVRIIPVCSKCIISPSNRDVTVIEIEQETRAEFKIRPLETGTAELVIEFHFIDENNVISPLGKERVNITIQKKPYELKLGGLTIRVSRKIPPLASAMGSIFTFVSFVLGQLGINLSAGVVASAATVGTGVGGVAMLGYGALLFLKSVKPLMQVLPIKIQ